MHCVCHRKYDGGCLFDGDEPLWSAAVSWCVQSMYKECRKPGGVITVLTSIYIMYFLRSAPPLLMQGVKACGAAKI